MSLRAYEGRVVVHPRIVQNAFFLIQELEKSLC